MKIDRTLFLAKLKALGAHLSISLVLVGIALALMLWRWFPAPLFHTDGGGVGLKLLLIVDLVLGPLLTFIVFNPAKARRLMAIDLGVIAALQLAAYGYGLHSIYSVRVQAVAYHEGVFHAVTAPAFKVQSIPADGWQPLGLRAPYLVNTRAPESGDEGAGVTAFNFTEGLEPHELHFLYEPLGSDLKGWSLAALEASHPEQARAAAQWLQAHPKVRATEAEFFPLEGYYGKAVLVLDAKHRWLGGYEGELAKISPSSASPRS